MKWKNYDLEIDEALLANIQRFALIEGENKPNQISFRLTKKGFETGVFNIKEKNSNHIRIQLEQNMNKNEEN